MGKNIVILGGGVGGLVSANILRKKLSSEHRVILIDKEEKYLFYPSLLWLLFGKRRTAEIQRNLNLLTKRGIEFIRGEIEEISVEKRYVVVDKRDIPYDYLIISLGAVLAKNYPKNERVFNFYCLSGAELSADAIKKFQKGKVVILISSLPFKCPAAPYELGFLLDSFFKNKNIRQDVELEIYTPELLPMPTAGPDIGNSIKGMITSRGIKFFPEYKLKSVEEKKIIFENRGEVDFDMLFVVPPHKSPEVVKNLTEGSGWISVDRETMKTKFENVYAIGDVTTIKLPGQYKPDKPLNLPKAGVFAHYQAEVVAENIAREINGQRPDKRFSGDGYCFLELGDDAAGLARGNFFALPSPVMRIYRPGRIWHLGKIAFEKWWLWKWF
jgi:sulfide:quinone oxidoreductase